MKKIACCIFAHDITKGMKSLGPIGIIKPNRNKQPYIIQQINYLKTIFKSIDFYIITGFEDKKIKNILPTKKYIHFIDNDKYQDTNQSYALKLFLNTITNKIDQYSGYFIIDQYSIIKHIPNKPKTFSWINTIKKNILDKDKLGVILNQDNVKYIFYNMGNIEWCHNIYISASDIKTLIGYQNFFHDNMFLFEAINALIDNQRLSLKMLSLRSIKDYISIVDEINTKTTRKLKKIL